MRKFFIFTISTVFLFIIGCGESTKSLNKELPNKSDFKIVSFKAVRNEFGGFRAIGEIKNIGSIASGVEVEVIARDKNGELVASQTFWPASINNVEPGSSTGIGYTITNDPRAKTLEIKIVRVEVWK